MAVGEDADSLDPVRRELDKRYGTDYHVDCHASLAAALDALRALADGGGVVALVLPTCGSGT